MTETTSTDVVKRAGGLTPFIETYSDDFAAVVPKHIEIAAFMGLASAMVRSDQYLRQAAQANPGSLIIALRQCAADGHTPRKGTASLVGYRDSRAPGGWSVQYIEEVAGTIERIYRAGAVTAIHDEIVRENDRFKPVRGGLPEHEFDWSASPQERGPLMGVYAWATLFTGGISRVVVLNRHDVARYRGMSASAKSTRGAPGGNFWGPEWPNEGPNTAAMWRKTALHRLERYVPASAAYRWEVAQAEAAALSPDRFNGPVPDAPLRGAVPSDIEPVEEDIQDAVIVDETPHEAATQGAWPDVRQPGTEGES